MISNVTGSTVLVDGWAVSMASSSSDMQAHVAELIHRGSIVGVNHDGGDRALDDRGPGDLHAGRELLELVGWCGTVVPKLLEVDLALRLEGRLRAGRAERVARDLRPTQ